MTTERCTCGETACESELCDCDATPCPVNHRAEQAEAARDALQATLKRIRVAVITAYGEDYAGGDTAVDVERLLRHLAEYEADMRRLLQSKNEALEQTQAERDALKAELAEAKRIMAAKPDPDSIEDLRERITEIFGSENESAFEAFMTFATAEVGRIACGEMSARWWAQDELAEARAAIERVKEIRDSWYRQPGMSEEADTLDAALDAPQRPEDTREETGRG